MELSERQRREVEFYGDFSSQTLTTEVNFDPVSGAEQRPWNSYWRVYQLAMEEYAKGARVLLDFCCGTGATSILFAKVGYEVHGFDITPANIEVAKTLAKRYKLSGSTHFSVCPAENTGFPSDRFDVVMGIDVLHHVEIEQAVMECRRVLKKNGAAIFREPVEAPVFDRLRKSAPIVKIFPKGRSLERHVTEDERKLNAKDLEKIRLIFPSMEADRFTFLSRLDPFLRDPAGKGPSLLERLDYRLLRAVPALGALGGAVVMKMRKTY